MNNDFFADLDTNSYKDNTVLINVVSPVTGNKMFDDAGNPAFAEFKSKESREWKSQLEENAKYAAKKANKDPNVDNSRMSDCRCLAAVTIRAHLPSVVSFEPSDLVDPVKRDQIVSALTKFYFDKYPNFTMDALEAIGDDTLFMQKPEPSSLNEKPTVDGAQVEPQLSNTQA